MRIVTDKQIRDFFLQLDSNSIQGYIIELHKSLQYFSNDNSIIPNRIVKSIPQSDVTHIYMPVISDLYSGLKNLVYNPSNGNGFVGTILIDDSMDGSLRGVLDAKEITGIRTAMASCIPLLNHLQDYINDDAQTLNVTVFGTGLQSFWHIFILIKLYEQSKLLKCINLTILFRNQELQLDSLLSNLENSTITLNIMQKNWNDNISDIITSSNIIFGCVPSTTPHLLYEDIMKNQKNGQCTYISLIGSYKPEMHECDSDLIDKFTSQNVKIIVDSIGHTLIEAGELIQSHVKGSQLLEIGQLSKSNSPVLEIHQKKVTICKIVGLAIMDIAVANKYLNDTYHMKS
ncbi:hypothetical protein TPHA_0B03620 [Tetrapisispora phaffii CBS 4417]|uniref:Ornithine cyclodeaminase n=1 Tax=Tetrapisispora phaffii (strain ATCC 24235 / CBS 4417 / NBRC 1672 / NRRL Y-8282 / UCD 70-5) TaxID=1071381 RepID=G8BPV1_TETPH|nr:hypothetical protein TPHA_0B03620 [Tetrapisispora phaffii CBS 4417]CCE62032.1 hypothetical protein TPHA_0B03620 [Tetrapisispora phaffii CBS 4417]